MRTAEGVSAAFLARPPQYHVEGPQPGNGADCPELVVDCSQQMLTQILKEDPTIRAAYAAVVETGRSQVGGDTIPDDGLMPHDGIAG